MAKGIVKVLIVVGAVVANYFFVVAIVESAEIWVRAMAYVVGVILNFAAGMLVNEVRG